MQHPRWGSGGGDACLVDRGLAHSSRRAPSLKPRVRRQRSRPTCKIESAACARISPRCASGTFAWNRPHEAAAAGVSLWKDGGEPAHGGSGARSSASTHVRRARGSGEDISRSLLEPSKVPASSVRPGASLFEKRFLEGCAKSGRERKLKERPPKRVFQPAHSICFTPPQKVTEWSTYIRAWAEARQQQASGRASVDANAAFRFHDYMSEKHHPPTDRHARTARSFAIAKYLLFERLERAATLEQQAMRRLRAAQAAKHEAQGALQEASHGLLDVEREASGRPRVHGAQDLSWVEPRLRTLDAQLRAAEQPQQARPPAQPEPCRKRGALFVLADSTDQSSKEPMALLHQNAAADAESPRPAPALRLQRVQCDIDVSAERETMLRYFAGQRSSGAPVDPIAEREAFAQHYDDYEHYYNENPEEEALTLELCGHTRGPRDMYTPSGSAASASRGHPSTATASPPGSPVLLPGAPSSGPLGARGFTASCDARGERTDRTAGGPLLAASCNRAIVPAAHPSDTLSVGARGYRSTSSASKLRNRRPELRRREVECKTSSLSAIMTSRARVTGSSAGRRSSGQGWRRRRRRK